MAGEKDGCARYSVSTFLRLRPADERSARRFNDGEHSAASSPRLCVPIDRRMTRISTWKRDMGLMGAHAGPCVRVSRRNSTLLLVRLGLVPCFYGYLVLIVATLGKTMSAPGQSPCIGVVVDCIMASLGLSRSAISALYLVATVSSAASLPKVGALVDRFGVQISVTVVACLLGGACFLLSVCSSAPMLLLCFYLLRLLGQGAIFLVSQNVINLWFVKLRGLVMGFAAAGASLGITAVVPSAMQSGIAHLGWRGTYQVLGASCLGFSLVGAAFFREAPERYALSPDGAHAPLAAADSAAGIAADSSTGSTADSAAVSSSAAAHKRPAPTADGGSGESLADGNCEDLSEPAAEPAWTRDEALRTAAFWSISAGCLSIALTGTAFWFHLSRIVTDQLRTDQGTDVAFAASPSNEETRSSDAGSRIADSSEEASRVLTGGSADASSGEATAALGSCGLQAAPAVMASIYATIAVSSTLARIVGGALSDRVPPRHLLAATLVLQAFSLALIPFGRSLRMLLLICTTQGVSQALMGSVNAVVYANFYGRAHLGAIGGVAKAMVVLGSALGPFPFGAAHDLTGTFDVAVAGSVALSLTCCFGALRYGHAPVKRPGAQRALRVPVQEMARVE